MRQLYRRLKKQQKAMVLGALPPELELLLLPSCPFPPISLWMLSVLASPSCPYMATLAAVLRSTSYRFSSSLAASTGGPFAAV